MHLQLPTDKPDNVPKLIQELRTLDVKTITSTSLHLLSKSESEQEVCDFSSTLNKEVSVI